MSGHTPGPWEVSLTGGRERAVFKVDDPGGQICKFPGPLFGRTAETKHANARLIAAAPDMLVALKQARDILTAHCNWQDVAFIDAAIAKAEGSNG